MINKKVILTAGISVLVILGSALAWFASTRITPTKGGLQVITNDIPSSVFVNDQYADKTPYINKELKPGTYTVKIQPDDPTLVPHETSIKVTAGLLSVVTWKPGNRTETSGGVIYEMEKLKPKSATSELFIVSLPDGAVVTVDSQTRDFTPLSLGDINPGQHEFEVSLPSYQTQHHTINALAGHKMIITVKLAKNEAQPTPSPTADTALVPNTTASQSATTPIRTASATSSAKVLAASTSSQVKILPTNFVVNGKEVLRMRAEPKTDGAEVGFVPVNTVATFLGEKSNGWLKIQYENLVGWVSGQYTQLYE